MLFSRITYLRLAKYVHYSAKQPTDMKFLNVAEKNDAAKTIAGLLSGGSANRREGYSVYNKVYDFEAQVRGQNAKMVMTSVSGHLMQVDFLASYRNWLNVDPRSLFDAPIRKTVGENYEPIKRTLEREVRGCQGLIIWTDCDREGENIGYEIINVCRAIKPSLTVYRASFSEITTASVRRALQQLGQPDKRQSDAVDVRTELDLRTGAAITRFQTMRLQRLFPEKIARNLISYGSCQIPTLGFVAERYKEIEAFVSEPFWKIRVLHTIEDLTVEFNWARNRLFDKEACENYLLLCMSEPEPRATVESVTVKPKHKWRPTPLDTVEMEKLGSRKLKLSAKETMTIAEKLYSQGIISYPRTETNQFSKEFELAPIVAQQTSHEAWGAFAQRVLEWGPNPRNGTKSDQAHPPIHPIKLVTGLQGNEARVYELVVRHFLACVSKDAVGSETIVNIDIAGEKFSANGLVIHERNYLDVYVYENWSAKQIHNYERGQRFEPTEIMLHEGATTAPPLLTEADLIALMEKHGIGTDATHAEHINTVKKRGYIGVVDKGALVPGIIGMGLYEGYDAMELALAKPLLRAEFEADLKRICLGEKDPRLVLSEQIVKYKQAYQQIMDKITAMDAKISQRLNETPAVPSATDNPSGQTSGMVRELFPCPQCDQAQLALKPKKNQTSFFIGCLNFPDCKNVVWLPEECKEYSVLDECCPNCGDGYHMLKFRLSSAYYRGLFNAPNGWYKNCLRCDELFRSTFNINLDQVKRVGGIVGQAAGPGGGAGLGPGPGGGGGGGGGSGGGGGPPSGGGPPRGGGSSGGSGPISGWGTHGSASGSQKTVKPQPKKPKATTAAGTATGAKKATRTKRTQSTESIRSYFTGRRQDTASLDGFFDSNDGFEEQLLAAATMVESIAPPEFDADIASAFADDDDADFEALVNGDSNSRPPAAAAVGLDTSLTQWIRNAYESEEQPMLWGRQARVAADVQPAAKRPRLNVNDSVALPAGAVATTTEVVLCSGCHQPARQQTVRRDGPNQGRQFYKCPKPKECKFFQWADEQPSATTSTASNWNSASSSSNSSSWGTRTDNQRVAGNSKEVGNSDWGSRGAGNTSSRNSPDTDSWGSGNNSLRTTSGTVQQTTSAPQAANSWGSKSSTAATSWGSKPPTAATSSSIGSSIGSTFMRSNSSSTVTITQPLKSSDIKCNCGKPASSLTVRKNGPNQGRPFYACPTREKTCGFFQWGDTDKNQEISNAAGGSKGASKSSWGSGNQRSQQQSEASGSRTGRRCGLCRGEGHTRIKCPRKAEFDY
ncbi:DNA topoisomerase 3-alpha isoform X2 [Drosophila grimshawi]|uniref:DNA topoisomerase 3-alpha isoform X2 n=1 Tax=Drosophila grimshawi TaxID=7222 RepID=UPI000C87146E|nr:DNA topoisomerase 3-alpha isoform X2 [Drosophila grimshawi]